jgi:glycosyltransferase involved in cell wall biosynthesis
VFVVHDDWLVYAGQHDQWIRMWRGRRMALAPLAERLCGVPTGIDLNAARSIVFNSRYTLERAQQAGIDTRGATVVHPGIDERFLEPQPPTPWAWRLAYVGRIDRQKGVDTAVAALAHLPPEATLAVWGTGDNRYIDEMKAAAARLGVADRVRFQGFADAAAIRTAYAAADVVVFPVRWEEPFGLVPLEAMGIGTPVVTTARGGTTEFVRDGLNALVFEADDASALAACITRLGGDPQLRAALRAGGQRTAARYTASEFADRTVDQLVCGVEGGPMGTGSSAAGR